VGILSAFPRAAHCSRLPGSHSREATIPYRENREDGIIRTKFHGLLAYSKIGPLVTVRKPYICRVFGDLVVYLLTVEGMESQTFLR
jgi:hypothetical protein